MGQKWDTVLMVISFILIANNQTLNCDVNLP